MASQALASTRTRPAFPGLAGVAAPLVVGLAALGVLFHQEIVAAIDVWIGSTAYNHCFLIIPIAAYLIWDRRDTLAGIEARPIPLLALAALPLGLAWLAAERIGFMEGRQLIAMTCVELMFLAVLGRPAYWLLCGPLLYLYFLVPFGDFLVPWLQNFTTWFVMHGLDVLGIVNYTDGYTIQIPEGNFFIAEACAGLRFLIASIAFGCLYALLIYRSAWKRAAFIVASLIVPVIANGFRALGIVTLGHLLGSAQAAETDHILYGWIFFSIVILILVALGLPFREDGGVSAPVAKLHQPTPADRKPILVAATVVVLLVALGPIAALALNREAASPGTVFTLVDAGDCQRLAPPSADSVAAAAEPRIALSRYSCGATSLTGLGVRLRGETFASRAGPREILDEQARLTHPDNIEDAFSSVVSIKGLPWTMTRTVNPTHLAASLLWQNGKPVAPGIRYRLRQAWHSMIGGGSPTVLIVVKPDPDLTEADDASQRRARLAIETFLASAKFLPPALDAAAPAQ